MAARRVLHLTAGTAWLPEKPVGHREGAVSRHGASPRPPPVWAEQPTVLRNCGNSVVVFSPSPSPSTVWRCGARGRGSGARRGRAAVGLAIAEFISSPGVSVPLCTQPIHVGRSVPCPPRRRAPAPRRVSHRRARPRSDGRLRPPTEPLLLPVLCAFAFAFDNLRERNLPGARWRHASSRSPLAGRGGGTNGMRVGAGGVPQSDAMADRKAVMLGLLLGSLGTAVCDECCGTGLLPAPGPAAPRSSTPGLRPWDLHLRLPAPTPSVLSGSHSLRIFVTGMTDPGPGMPQFVAVGYVDGELVGKYDSKIRRAQLIVDWLHEEDREHWDMQTQRARDGELGFFRLLRRLQEHYNKSGGSHTLQKMFGCDILEDGSIRGYDQYAFDGRDYITFNLNTMTFTAADAVAEITKRRWEAEGTYAERWKHMLGTLCVENLRRYLAHGKAALKRRERPEVRVWGKEADGILTLSCRAHGFYPRPIAISWMKDGMVRDQETHWGGIVPNSDGTYHTWVTIHVLPEDRDKYWCHVEHASLLQPGLFSWEPQSILIPFVAGAVIAIVAVITAVVGLVVWKRKSGKEKKGYTAALGRYEESCGSAAGSEPSI